ncbi:MFS transporter [Streptomyces sp. TRM68416]|uniref:MFS transporter n=1 Tax=Streptomyces sp. TRM68416 TaxID=2758412 RepID=UPI0016620A70|nr:MFS transporter [Streptomyces sp. TRM68416]MBD0843380.1 MFS transporter [Streptomyces sp. TRM68416]
MTSTSTRPADDTPDTSVHPPLRRNRNFRRLWLGSGAALLGNRAAVTAYPLLYLWAGGSPAEAGLVGFASLLPQLLVLLPAGALVDRLDRRRVLISCSLAGLTAMATLVVALLAGRLWLWHVMAVAFVQGAAGILHRLAERAAVRHVVPEEQLRTALSQSEARGHGAGLLGQPMGAALFSAARWLPFCAAALGHLVALATVFGIRADLQDKARPEPRSLRREIREGLVWVWRQRFMRASIALVGGSNLAFQLITLAMVLIVKENGHSAATVGILGVLGGLGGLTGALVAPWINRRVPVQGILIGALMLWSVLMGAVAVADHPVQLGALMAGMSGAGALLNVAAGSYQVLVTPDAMQGRATSVFTLIGSGLNSLGALLGGFLLHAFGSTTAVLGAAAAMALLALLALASPVVRRGGGSRAEAGNTRPNSPDQ